MNARVLAVCLLLTSFSDASGFAQDDEFQIKRFKQVIHACLNRSKARTELQRIVVETAKSLELTEGTAEKLNARVPDTITAFVGQTAKKWNGDIDLANLERPSLTASTMLIEDSPAWQKMLEDVLTEEQVEAWSEEADKRNKTPREEFKEQTKLAERKKAEREARLEQVAIQRAAAVVAMNGVGDARGQKETLVRACRGVAKQLKSQAETQFLDELQWMETALELAPKQVRRLEVAVKGVLKKQFDEVITRVDVINDETPEGDDESEQLTELREIYSKLRAWKSDGRNERWARSIKSTLDDEQFKQYRDEQKARAVFYRATQIQMIIMTLDKAARLSVKQRKELTSQLKKFDGSLGLSKITTASSLYRAMSSGLRSIVTDVLSEAQIEKVTQPANRNLERLGR